MLNQVKATMAGKRRICWPSPDKWCVQGECNYCNDKRPRNINVIRAYAVKSGMLDSFQYGFENDFFNAVVSE